MSVFQSFILGLVQGFSEFLPISSSGHLVFFRFILGFEPPDISFDIFLHLISALTIMVYFRHDIITISRRQLQLIVIANIPIFIVGFLFADAIQGLFQSVLFVGGAFMVTGLMNLYTDRVLESRARLEREAQKVSQPLYAMEQLSLRQAFIIGLFQVAAILPGISRSGSTVCGAMTQGVRRADAFRFSFLLVLPVIFGAVALDLYRWGVADFMQHAASVYLAGGIATFAAGFASLRIFELVIKRARMQWFGWYCIILGISTIALFFIG